MAEDSNPGGRPVAAAAPEFATFWHGPLNGLAYGCLASFPAVGAGLRVYAYEDTLELPPGVELADARRICPDESLLRRYLTAGKPSLAAFADQFRYKLIRETGCCWVDADLICLRKPDFRGESIVFGRQSEAFGKALINNAVLKLPSAHPVLSELNKIADEVVDVDQPWGAIGPFLLTELAEKYGIDRYARDFTDFYPIEPDQFWKPLLPSQCAGVAAAVARATFLHLWGELYARSSYDKAACPPAGSFIHGIFQRLGVLGRFERIYGEDEIVALVAGWAVQEKPPGRPALTP